MIVAIPPLIRQRFSAALLCTPLPIQDSQTLWQFYSWIKERFERKKRSLSKQKIEKVEKDLKEFLELYERAKIKEKEQKEKTNIKTQGLFYSIRTDNRDGEAVHHRSRYGRWLYDRSYEFKNNDAIYKMLRRKKLKRAQNER